MDLKLITMAIVCLFIANFAFAAGHNQSHDEIEKRYISLTKRLRCLTCPNQSLFESATPISTELRSQIHYMLSTGDSDESIVNFVAQSYSDYVLYKPRFTTRTWVLWLGPILMFGIAVLFFYRLLKLAYT